MEMNIMKEKINEIMTQDIDCKYTHNQRLRIIRGFYKGNYATVKNVESVGDKIIYNCLVVLGNKENMMKFDEESLKEIKFHIPFMN
jgi:hypothetical protein